MVRSPRSLTRAFIVVSLLVVACGGTSAADNPTPGPGFASAIDGRFELRFSLDSTALRRDENVTGTAELWLRAGGSGALSGPSEVFGFEFVEVGGERRAVAPVLRADCAPHQVGSDRPLTSPVTKSGVASSTFAGEFLRGPDVHLPVGVWDITAIAGFVEGRSCQGQPHTIRATVRIRVAG